MQDWLVCVHSLTWRVIGGVCHNRFKVNSTNFFCLLLGRGEMRHLRVGLVSPALFLIEIAFLMVWPQSVKQFRSLSIVRWHWSLESFNVGENKGWFCVHNSRAHATGLGFQNPTHQSRACFLACQGEVRSRWTHVSRDQH